MISIFGKTASVADLGALTRIALVLIVPQAIVSKIIEPKLARAREGADLWRKFGVSVLCVAAMAAGAFTLFFLFRHQFLCLLGQGLLVSGKGIGFLFRGGLHRDGDRYVDDTSLCERVGGLHVDLSGCRSLMSVWCITLA